MKLMVAWGRRKYQSQEVTACVATSVASSSTRFARIGRTAGKRASSKLMLVTWLRKAFVTAALHQARQGPAK